MKIHAPNITGSLVGNISGSATSTGSFGLILGDGRQLTNLPASFTSAGISGSFTDASSSLASRIETREAFTTQSFSDGTATTISGSVVSTGSFGHIMKSGVNWDTAVSTSAATAGFGGGGGGGTPGGSNTQVQYNSSDAFAGSSNLTFDGTNLTVGGDLFVNDYARIDALRVGTTSTDPGDGNLWVEGDITLDDGGSLKEAGGTTAITFDGSGHVTKIGQASPSTNHVLTWDGSKWASAVVNATVTGGTGLFGQGTTVGGVLFKTPGSLTGSFSDTITISTGSMYVTSASLITPSISSGDIDITTAVHIKGSKDAGYASSYGFDGSISISSYLYDLHFSPDGRKLFALDGHSNKDMYSFELKTPWDIATQQYIGTHQNFTETYPQGFTMHPDGTHVYVVGSTADGITEYALTIPWDLTTVTEGKSINIGTVDNAVNEDTPTGIDWKPDGTKVYLTGTTTKSVLQYAVTGSDFDIGSLTFEYQMDVPIEETNPYAIRFKQDGSQMFILGTQKDEVIQYNLSKNWDISSARFVNNFSVNSEETIPRGLFLKPDNSGFFICGTGGDEVNEYKFQTYDSGSYIQKLTIGANTDIYGDVDIKGKLTLQQPWANDFKTEANFNHGISSLTGSINVSNISNPIDITTATYKRTSADPGTIGDITDIVFKPDGKVVILSDDYNVDKIYQYTLSTPWDISTLNTAKIAELSVSSQESNIYGFTMSIDGYWLFVVGGGDDGINSYNLSTPWDISTASAVKGIDLDLIANRVNSESSPY